MKINIGGFEHEVPVDDDQWIYFMTEQERLNNAPFRPGEDQWYHFDERRWLNERGDTDYMPRMLPVRRPKPTETLHFL